MNSQPDRITPSLVEEDISVSELGSQIVGLSGRLAAATCRWLLLVAAFDARDGCARWGLASTARWLSYSCGLSRRTAVEHVRVARGLAAFPVLSMAMAAGRLSYSQVRAITRLARPGEERLVADLIEVAKSGTVGQLESMVRGLRSVDTAASERGGNDPCDAGAPSAGDDSATEYASGSWAEDSRWRFTARWEPERGALVDSVIRSIARSDGVSEVEALVRMAEIAQAALNDSGAPPRILRGEERAAVVIHVNSADVPAAPAPPVGAPVNSGPVVGETPTARRRRRKRPRTPARPWARIADGPGLPPAVVTRLLCAGRVRTVLHGPGAPDAPGGAVLDVGRSHRVVTERQWRALLARDGGCAHPGCGATRGIEAHHVRHWIYGGATDMGNLVVLCGRHHHAHHDGEFVITPGRVGRFRFTRADGTALPHTVDPAAHISAGTPGLEAEHAEVAADAAATGWDGERLDRAWAVGVLAERRSRTAC